METINIEFSENILNKKALTQPINAIKEIIWNSCDADASKININILREENALGKEVVTGITAIDNGHGLAYDKLHIALSNYSDSEKALKYRSPQGRVYHGKLGEGRYTYFALGNQIIWKSIYNDGKSNKEFQLEFNSSNKKQVKVDDLKESKEHCGMHLKIINTKSYNIDKEYLISELLLEFAAYLLAHNDIQILIEDKKLDIISQIKKQKDFSTKIEAEGKFYDINVKIILWKDKQKKTKYICGEDNVVYHEDLLKISENICIYVSSPYFDELKKNNLIDALNYDKTASAILKFADEKLHEFIVELKTQSDSELLNMIKEDEAYPTEFKGTITDNIILKKQEIFDLVAVEVVKNISPIKDTRVRKLNYQLIVEAINSNPSSLKKILEEVFNLSKEKQDELASILEHVTLNNIITTMQEVSNRLTFLDVLYEIIYGDSCKKMKERTEFQKILEDELWIFGDQYKFGATDESLRKILIKHIKELGREEFIGTIDLNNEQLNNIPDICLFNKQKIGTKYQNLIVEIKRPTVDIGEEQISQIKKYAYAIKDEPGFDNQNSVWNFILIGRNLTKFALHELEGKKDCLLHEMDNIKIYVKKWADLIEEEKLRYEYFKELSKLKISNEDITKDLQNRWAKIAKLKQKD